MKNLPWKKILAIVCFGLGAYAVYSIYEAFKNGERTVAGLLAAPFTALKSVGSAIASTFNYSASAPGADIPVVGTVAGGLNALDNLPDLISQDQTLTQQTQTLANQSYAPGGENYNTVAATQGQAAADANWAKVQADYANENQQVAADSNFSIWNPLTW
jgi:hypothetical protein